MNDITEDAKLSDVHRPTQDFRDYLDDEVVRTFRQGRALRRLRAAAVILVTVALGASAGLASAQMRDGAQRDSLLSAAQADAMLASVRLRLAQARLGEGKKLVSVGARSSESLASAEAEVQTMESQLGRVAFNIDEIKATASAPRDDLNAPTVNGRDFVKDRIQLQLMTAQAQMQAAERTRDEMMRRVRAGVADKLAGVDADLAVLKTQRDMMVLIDRLALRREFLEKGTPVDQLMRRLELTEVRQDMNVTSRSLDLARQRVGDVEKARSAGVTGELDVMKAKLEAMELEVALQRLGQRLNQVRRPM
ncbi:MAG: hypothetical protein ABJE10_08345 [bacterium]